MPDNPNHPYDIKLAIRGIVDDGRFLEVFCDASLDVCESRDPKGLYAKARAGEIKNFTGIDDPYEPPESPELHLNTDGITPEEAAEQVLAYLRSQGKIS